jgi:hypothetical protein
MDAGTGVDAPGHDAGNAGDTGGSVDASDAGCPASCTKDTDCSTCPVQGFGGWSCGPNGMCMFMG